MQDRQWEIARFFEKVQWGLKSGLERGVLTKLEDAKREFFVSRRLADPTPRISATGREHEMQAAAAEYLLRAVPLPKVIIDVPSYYLLRNPDKYDLLQRHNRISLQGERIIPSTLTKNLCFKNMKTQKKQPIITISLAIFFSMLAAISAPAQSGEPASSPTPNNVSVYSTGLNNPRGLKFGPDGNLYVAEGGFGGTISTVGHCEQSPGGVAGIGPYTGNPVGARISKIIPSGAHGFRTTILDNLPSSQTSAASGSLISGVADVAFVGNTLYALLGGAGCSHGIVSTPNGVIRRNPGGNWTLIADLSAFQMAHPVAHPNPDDFEPDGTWYSMVEVNGDLYALEPNHGELDKITTAGVITRVIDISATQGHIVPTAMDFYRGNFYVGNLRTFPIVQGSSKLFRITPAGQITQIGNGFTTILGVAFDKTGRLYVLENTTGNNQFPTPGTGTILRLNSDGSRTVIASGLFLPTAMTFGPDDAIYVSNKGFGLPPNGLGQILRVTLPAEPVPAR